MWAKGSQSHSLYRPKTHLPEGTEGTAEGVSDNPTNDENAMLEEEKKSDVSGAPNTNRDQDNNSYLCNAATTWNYLPQGRIRKRATECRQSP